MVRSSFSVLNEVVATGNPELIGMVLQYRDQQQARARSQEIPLMLERLQSAPDFYIEMKWEFSSWSESVCLSHTVLLLLLLLLFPLSVSYFHFCAVPFVSRMCPSDTYKIWKKGMMS